MADTDDVTPQADKPTDQWVTGDEPMTGPQQSYVNTLAQEAGEEPKDGLSKAAASEEIDRLQQETGRGA
jgi:heme-binding NEAT domain protein